MVLLLAAACGGEDTPPDSTAPADRQAAAADAPPTPAAPPLEPDAPPTPPTPPAEPDAPPAPAAPPAEADAPEVSPAAEPSPPSEPPPAPVAASEPTSEPTYRGTLFFGLEAETPDGWNPATQSCAVSCHTVMRAVFDPLTVTDADGEPRPYLLESFEADEDFTIWTFKMRPGVKFHDGTPADAHALATHFRNLLGGALPGQTLQRLTGWEVIDDLTLEIYSEVPFAGLPGGLTGQLGYLAAPSQYADPDGAANPVGTGPFVFKSWIPDQELVVERNADYWRTDAAGRALPYLDRIVFRPIHEADSRKVALGLGDIHVTHSDVGLDFDYYRQNYETTEERSFLQTRHLLLNNAVAPFDSVEGRRALAHCTDHETYNLLRTGGNFDVANGPFAPNTPGHLSDTGFPGYDLEAGRALWERLGDPGPIVLGTSNEPFDRTSAELLVQMWEACGLEVRISQLDQGALIRNAVLGNFQVNLWRNHDGTSLATERVWWHSNFTTGLALNLGRIRNEALDDALNRATVTTDRAELRQIAEEVNRILAEGVHNVWLHWVEWILPHRDEVRNLARITMPDGSELLNILRGRAFLTETWLD
ncbi:MAG: ABC transporter substrate-binding protein [bacterium]|nr:ABC transporter substrate-binding protein [bacterium]